MEYPGGDVYDGAWLKGKRDGRGPPPPPMRGQARRPRSAAPHTPHERETRLREGGREGGREGDAARAPTLCGCVGAARVCGRRWKMGRLRNDSVHVPRHTLHVPLPLTLITTMTARDVHAIKGSANDCDEEREGEREREGEGEG